MRDGGCLFLPEGRPGKLLYGKKSPGLKPYQANSLSLHHLWGIGQGLGTPCGEGDLPVRGLAQFSSAVKLRTFPEGTEWDLFNF